MKTKVMAAAFAAVILLSGCSGNSDNPSGDQSTQGLTNTESISSSPAETNITTTSETSNSSEESTSPAVSETEKENGTDAPAPVFASNTKPEDYSTEPVDFKTEIDEFNKQVEEMPLPGGYEQFISDGYSIRKLEIDGTPLYEVKKNNDNLKPLVIQMHGGFDQKNIDYALELVQKEEGLCVLSIDCAGSGESQDGPLQAPAAWMETVKDIDTLIEYYNTISDVDAKNFGLIGFSMGGNISEYYTVYGEYKPTSICLENAGADLTGSGASWDCFDKGKNALPPIWEEEQMWNFTTATAPLAHPEYFKDVRMYICVGAEDDIHSPQKMEEFKNAVEALGNENIIYHYYEDVGHETPRSWIDNERKDFLAKMCS